MIDGFLHSFSQLSEIVIKTMTNSWVFGVASLVFLGLFICKKTRVYVKIWMPIILFLFCGIFATHHSVGIIRFLNFPKTDMNYYLLAFKPFSVIALSSTVIIWVCISYLLYIITLVSKIPNNTFSMRLWNFSMLLLVICIILTIVFMCYIVSVFYTRDFMVTEKGLGIIRIVDMNEFLGIVIFTLFILIDYFIILSIPQQLDRHYAHRNELMNARWIAINSLYIVDWPCLIGVLFIIMLKTCYSHCNIADASVQTSFGIFSFSDGFSAGAIAIHIVFTQSNFAYLKTIEAMKLKHNPLLRRV